MEIIAEVFKTSYKFTKNIITKDKYMIKVKFT